MSIDHLEFTLSKASYLFNHESVPGKGGDKQKIWRSILGFDSPEAIREAILARVSIDQLEAREVNSFGEKYQITVLIEGPSGVSWLIRTGWIVLAEENVARFVTAFPERLGRQS